MFEWILNPLLKKEIRTRMRGKTVFIVENLYLLLIAGVLLLVFYLSSQAGEYLGWNVGRTVFQTITVLQAVLLVLVSPSIVASSITLEREQKTFDILLATPLSERKIIWNKLLAAISYFLLLIVISVPLLCICFILGGISPGEILLAYLVTLLSVMVYGAIGLYFSVIFKRTVASVPVSNLVVILIIVMTAYLSQALGALSTINPLYSLAILYNEGVVRFLDFTIPFWIPCVILSLESFFWIINLALNTLRNFLRRRYILLQTQTLLLYNTILFFFLGVIFDPAKDIRAQKDAILVYVSAHLSALVLICPILLSQGEAFGQSGQLQAVKKKCIQGIFKLYAAVMGYNIWNLLILMFSGFIVLGLLLLAAGIRMTVSNAANFIVLVAVTLTCITAFSFLIRVFYSFLIPKGVNIVRIVSFITIVLILIGPVITSGIFHMNEKEPRYFALDYLLVSSPYLAYSYTFYPKGSIDGLPALQPLTKYMPLPLFTILIYTLLTGLFAGIRLYQYFKRKTLNP